MSVPQPCLVTSISMENTLLASFLVSVVKGSLVFHVLHCHHQHLQMTLQIKLCTIHLYGWCSQPAAWSCYSDIFLYQLSFFFSCSILMYCHFLYVVCELLFEPKKWPCACSLRIVLTKLCIEKNYLCQVNYLLAA